MKLHRLLVSVLLFMLAAGVSKGASDIARPFPVEVQKTAFMSGGQRIGVEVFAPKAPGRFPAVLVLHSSAGTLIGKGELTRLSKQLAGQGMVAFLVRYFDRTGTIMAGDEAIDRLSPLWVATVKDGVDFVRADPRVQPHAIGMFGYSLGAFVAVAESSRDGRIKAVASVAGGIFEGFEGRMQRLPPLLIVHGREDQRVPVRRAMELAAAARRLGATSEMKLYAGEGHRLSQAVSEDASRRVISFLKQHLQDKRDRPSSDR